MGDLLVEAKPNEIQDSRVKSEPSKDQERRQLYHHTDCWSDHHDAKL